MSMVRLKLWIRVSVWERVLRRCRGASDARFGDVAGSLRAQWWDARLSLSGVRRVSGRGSLVSMDETGAVWSQWAVFITIDCGQREDIIRLVSTGEDSWRGRRGYYVRNLVRTPAADREAAVIFQRFLPTLISVSPSLFFSLLHLYLLSYFFAFSLALLLGSPGLRLVQPSEVVRQLVRVHSGAGHL